MKKIAVIGATGKVGTELCLTLSLMGTHPIAICRSSLAATFLERCGIECRVGSVADSGLAPALLGDADVIFDLSLPRKSVSESRALSRRIMENALAAAAPHARYVFTSTYMALGMNSPGQPFRHHLFAGSNYGATKRVLERLTAKLGRKYSRDTYVLRLGQVHGELQPVSRFSLELVRQEPRVIVPAGPSNTVFVFSIAEAARAIAEGHERPGLYMMTSSPQWSWKDLHAYFARRSGREVEIREATVREASGRAFRGLAGFALRHREFFTGYVLPHFPEWESRVKAAYARRSAAAQIAELGNGFIPIYQEAYRGEAPGSRLASLTDSRQTMEPVRREVRRLIDAAVQ